MDRELRGAAAAAGRKVIKDRGEKTSRIRPRVVPITKETRAQPRVVPITENCYTSSNLWQNGVWISSFPEETSNMCSNHGDQDFSPGFALRRIALLFENRKWEDCAQLIDRLSLITLRTIIPELPVDVIMDIVPSSLPILEALYTKFHTPGDN